MRNDTLLPPREGELRREENARRRERFDILYGKTRFTVREMSVIRHEIVRAMFGRSQGSIPATVTLTGNPTTTGEHALGTMWLGKLLLEPLPELRHLCPQLILSCLLHDAAGAPFRHVSDFFMKMSALNCTHEQRLFQMLEESSLGRLLKKQGYSLDEIYADCAGTSAYGGILLDGPLGADTLDNVLRYCISKGLFAFGWSPADFSPMARLPHSTDVIYSPEKIVGGYRLTGDGTLCISEDVEGEIVRYLNCRKLMYAHIGSMENRVPEAMLRRAIGFAYAAGEIFTEEGVVPPFFSMSDAEALTFLRTSCNGKTRAIIGSLESLDWYHTAYFGYGVEGVQPAHSGALSFVSAPSAWMEIADEVAGLLGKRPENVCVYLQKGDPGYRDISVPILSSDGSLRPFRRPAGTQRWQYQVQVFIKGRMSQSQADELESFMDRATLSGRYAR